MAQASAFLYRIRLIPGMARSQELLTAKGAKEHEGRREKRHRLLWLYFQKQVVVEFNWQVRAVS
jgi:hypothetical protein